MPSRGFAKVDGVWKQKSKKLMESVLLGRLGDDEDGVIYIYIYIYTYD